jgi:uncharacterized repeat protein (TIGR04076 family)
MPYKVRCKLVAFQGDPQRFPCHFDYKIGDVFTYNGEKFEGRVCNGLLKNMVPVIWNTIFYGAGEYDRMLYLYTGLSARDPAMKPYDGIGFRPLKTAPEGADVKYLKSFSAELPADLIRRTRGFVCDDSRTGAYFICEPAGLADGGDMRTHYNREINILEKIKKEPGLSPEEIMARFTQWEREEIYPPLSPLNLSLMLNELATVSYIELREGKAYPLNPPSQPEI